MDEQTAKRTRRTPQQMAEDVDSKIEKLNQELETLAAKRAVANEDFDKKEAWVGSAGGLSVAVITGTAKLNTSFQREGRPKGRSSIFLRERVNECQE